MSKTHDHAAEFPKTAHAHVNTGKGTWIKPHYYDDVDMVNHLSKGTFYQPPYFREEVVELQCATVEIDDTIERWSDQDQHQLCHEAF